MQTGLFAATLEGGEGHGGGGGEGGRRLQFRERLACPQLTVRACTCTPRHNIHNTCVYVQYVLTHAQKLYGCVRGT